jgi:chaperonin GroEL (HSP60 family)
MSITLEDKFENLSARYVLMFLHESHPTPSLVQDVVQKTNEMAGDGTTTATVLARAIYSKGVKNIAAGCNLMDLRRGSQAAVDNLVQFLSAQTKTITTTVEIAQVATISANGDTHVGNLIAQAIARLLRNRCQITKGRIRKALHSSKQEEDFSAPRYTSLTRNSGSSTETTRYYRGGYQW